MQSFILKLLIPLILATAVFGAINVYGTGLEFSLFGGLGSASAVLIISLIVASLSKLFNREWEFLNTHLGVFIIIFVFFVISTLYVASYERAQRLGTATVVPHSLSTTLGRGRVIMERFG